MRSHCVKYHRLYTSLFLGSLLLMITACTTAWTSEASAIVSLLEAAIPAALAILSAFGIGLPADTLMKVQAWGGDANSALARIKTLIEQYNTAEAAAKPGLLTEIQTALGLVSSNLTSLLPLIKVTNKDTQDKIIAVVQAIADELVALGNLVPAVQGVITNHADLKALVSALKSPKEFKTDFNAKAAPFGTQYQLK